MKTLKTRLIVLIAALSAFGLVGCTITAKEFNKGVEKCKDNGGLEELHFSGPVCMTAYCNNGAVFHDIEAD